MIVWGLSDLHLSLARPDGLEAKFPRRRDQTEKIEANWRACVDRDDIVLIPGDFSMARDHRDLQADLAWLDRLPGTKVLSAGNHDRWWNGVARIRKLLRRSQRAVGGDAIELPGVIVCGTLGAPYVAEDESHTIAGRDSRSKVSLPNEVAALEKALSHAKELRNDDRPIIAMWHYSPFDRFGRPGPCSRLVEAAGASACVFGHAHAVNQWASIPQGLIRGVLYRCVAADAVGFHPLRILEIA